MMRALTSLLVVVSLGLSGCRHSAGADLANSAEKEKTIEALRGAYAAFNRGDIDAAVAPLDADIEWTEPVSFPNGGMYHGREGARKYLAQSRAGLAEGTSEPEQFIVAGNRIVVFVHAHVRPKASGEWLDIRLADVYTVKGGRIVAMNAFADRDEALKWAGAAAKWAGAAAEK